MNSTQEAHAQRELIAPFVMSVAIGQLCVNIGYVDSARKAINVNFFMNMIWAKCLNATFTPDLVSVVIFCILSSLAIIFIVCVMLLITDACHNKECPFLHIDPESKMKDCPWYDRGFCRHGPNCRHRHVRRVLCMNYVAGFCPDGPDCKFMQYVYIGVFEILMLFV